TLSLNNISGPASSYVFDFGDNSNLTSTDTGLVQHVYQQTGSFQIRMIASSGQGCSDTAYYSVFIKSGAKADFTVNHPFACSPAVFEFTNQSLLGQDYYWFANDSLVFEGADLPDTLISTDSSIIHYRLVATSSSSCQGDTAEMTIFTPANPIASFDDPGTGCGPLNLNFNNTSEFHIRSNWNLGNGTVSQLENPVASYQAAAQGDSIYSISLIVDN